MPMLGAKQTLASYGMSLFAVRHLDTVATYLPNHMSTFEFGGRCRRLDSGQSNQNEAETKRPNEYWGAFTMFFSFFLHLLSCLCALVLYANGPINVTIWK